MNSITFDLRKSYTGGRKRINLSNNGKNLHPYWIEVPNEYVDRVTLTSDENLIGVYFKKFLGEIEPNGVAPNGAPDLKRVKEVYSKQIPVPPEMKNKNSDHILTNVREVLEKSLD
ncbi:MAG: hypothetical protein KAW40_01135 [Candidatus Aenigmarchaeota archaeon]|nr:hypothetical protein [Candidatus Aenigmarchaeota archaeon]